jgi:hypothetical protein
MHSAFCSDNLFGSSFKEDLSMPGGRQRQVRMELFRTPLFNYFLKVITRVVS